MTIESSAMTEEMRHIPSLERLVRLLDREIRPTLRLLLETAADPAAIEDASLREILERELRSICKRIECVAELARTRPEAPQKPPRDLRDAIERALDRALAALSALDAGSFRRRTPSHHFDRSKGEPVTSAVAAVQGSVERLVSEMVVADPSLTARLRQLWSPSSAGDAVTA
jgi:hypothetical protein